MKLSNGDIAAIKALEKNQGLFVQKILTQQIFLEHLTIVPNCMKLINLFR